VVALAAQFVPAADEVHRLQKGSDPECLLFQSFCEEGHYGGRTRPTDTRQGTYCATPSGMFLASVNSNDPERIAQMLETALAKWSTLSREGRLMAVDPATQTPRVNRGELRYPADGLVLRVTSRDFPRAVALDGWRGNAWNFDYAWFTREEARALLPVTPRAGARQQVPRPLVERLVRFHLVDNVRGQTISYPSEAVKQAELASEVTGREGNIISLRLSGATHAEAETRVSGRRGQPAQMTPFGYQAQLFGRAQYDLAAERFISFELLASGQRWGATQYNFRRGDDAAPGPLGIALTLAGDSPAERVAPAHFGAYGWN